jgi:type I restriction enzyme S subunit
VWARLSDLGEFGRGKSRHRPRNDPRLFGGKYPFIQTGEIARSGGRITAHTQSYSEFGLAQSRLWPIGTVCITIAANIADSALLTYPACFPDSVVGLVSASDVCVPEYIEFFIRTARNDLSQFAPATAQKNINLKILNEVMVPLPPLEEQREIVQRDEELLEIAARAERHVAMTNGRSDKLLQAVLVKAFRGELVPTEAELARAEGRQYESATQLLERIQAERAARELVKAGRAKKKKKEAAPPVPDSPRKVRKRAAG